VLSEDINQMQVIHPEFWEILVEKHFIIPDETDELQQVKDLVQSIDCNPEHYHLIINPTLNCNFKCWYCYETHIRGSKMDKKTIEKMKLHIASKLDNDPVKHFIISWFGGEPLLCYKEVIIPILKFAYEYVKNKNIQFNFNFTSNGFLINDKMLQALCQLGVNNFQITLDGHRKQHNKVKFMGNGEESYDIVVSNIKKCLKLKIYVTCRLNISKDTFQNIEKVIDDFADLSLKDREFLTFSFHKVWQEDVDFHCQILELIELFKNNNFSAQTVCADGVRNSCYADKKHHATINYNGDVFKCTARDFTPENREGILNENGDIEWNEKYYARMEVKFKNPSCLICKILPVCNGGCSQKAIDKKDENYCVHGFDENRKIAVIQEKLESILN